MSWTSTLPARRWLGSLTNCCASSLLHHKGHKRPLIHLLNTHRIYTNLSILVSLLSNGVTTQLPSLPHKDFFIEIVPFSQRLHLNTLNSHLHPAHLQHRHLNTISEQVSHNTQPTTFLTPSHQNRLNQIFRPNTTQHLYPRTTHSYEIAGINLQCPVLTRHSAQEIFADAGSGMEKWALDG